MGLGVGLGDGLGLGVGVGVTGFGLELDVEVLYLGRFNATFVLFGSGVSTIGALAPIMRTYNTYAAKVKNNVKDKNTFFIDLAKDVTQD